MLIELAPKWVVIIKDPYTPLLYFTLLFEKLTCKIDSSSLWSSPLDQLQESDYNYYISGK